MAFKMAEAANHSLKDYFFLFTAIFCKLAINSSCTENNNCSTTK